MEIFDDIFDWTAPEEGCVLVLGRFDGVHLGHVKLLNETIEIARKRKLNCVCFSFSEITYPGAILRGILTTDEEKSGILGGIGIDVLLNPAFEQPLIQTSHHDFLKKIMVEQWRAKAAVVGFDFRFGY